MRLFILAACVLFAIAGVVASFSVTLVIPAIAWVAWGLLAFGLDFLFGGWVLPIATRSQPAAQPVAAQPPAQV